MPKYWVFDKPVVSDGKMHDVGVLDILPIEAGAFYVMDRGYVDFARLYKMHQAGAFFVTRAKSNMNARRVYSTATDRTTGVICDQLIAMNGYYVSKDYPWISRKGANTFQLELCRVSLGFWLNLRLRSVSIRNDFAAFGNNFTLKFSIVRVPVALI